MKKLLLIGTGGTIASTDQGNGLEPTLSIDELLKYLPELPEECELEGIQLLNLDSTNVSRVQWNQMIAKLDEVYDQYDGFIIAHGTDTLAYTASVLSYMVQQSKKPIVITGAQHSLTEEGSDGVKNLYDSILVAMDEKSHGVLVVFDGDIIIGTRVKKNSSVKMHAMESINYPMAGIVTEHQIQWNMELEAGLARPWFQYPKVPSIHLVKVTPYINIELIELVFHNYKCVVLEGFGSGNLPEALYKDLKFLSKMYDTFVVIGTQVVDGGTDMSAYEVGKRYLDLPQVVETKDMTIEAALAKVFWMQSQDEIELEDMKRIFEQPIWYDRM